MSSINHQSLSPGSTNEPQGGRFLTPDGVAHDCQVRNLTMSGATLTACAVVPDDTRIIIYMDGIGRFAADVIAPCDHGMDVKFDPSKCKIEALRSHLATIERAESMEERRRHRRINPQTPFRRLTLPDGEIHQCEVTDVSLSGAFLKVDVFLPLGTGVCLEDWWGRITDRRDDGVAIRFDEELTAEAIARLAT